MKYDYEMTDTLGGEANYCWVRRGTVEASTWRGAILVLRRCVRIAGAPIPYDMKAQSHAFQD